MYHLKKALDIAYVHHFLYPIANIAVYYPDLFKKVLSSYPVEFSDKIWQCGEQMDRSFAAFMKRYHISDLYSSLAKGDYQYIFYAAWGYSYKQVANILHLSVRTVAGRYAKIYDKLGVNSRHELFQVMEGTTEIKEKAA